MFTTSYISCSSNTSNDRSPIFKCQWNSLQSYFIFHPFIKCEIYVAYQSVYKLYRLSDAYYVVTLNEREREL